jgi:acyl carrier protein
MSAQEIAATNVVDVDAVLAALADILVDQLNVNTPVAEIDELASLEDDLGLDSVAMVELIGAIEAEFGFEFHDSDLRTSAFQNLRVLAEVVANRIHMSRADV